MVGTNTPVVVESSQCWIRILKIIVKAKEIIAKDGQNPQHKIIETANKMELELAIDYAWTTFKVVFACSPIIAIVAILALAREDEDEEAAKRKIKCARS